MASRWSEEKIKAGFDIFIKEHQRLPTAAEIDESPHLPSSRAIQKRYGGLVVLREKLGYAKHHFGRGDARSEIALAAKARNDAVRTELESWLLEQFGIPAVTVEYTYLGKYRVNFYIQTDSGNFAVDVFFAKTIRTLQSNINLKMKKYHCFEKPLYLVSANPEISTRQISTYCKRRKSPLPEHIQLLSLQKFKTLIQKYIFDTQNLQLR